MIMNVRKSILFIFITSSFLTFSACSDESEDILPSTTHVQETNSVTGGGGSNNVQMATGI